jgi:hypothetical protein
MRSDIRPGSVASREGSCQPSPHPSTGHQSPRAVFVFTPFVYLFTSRKYDKKYLVPRLVM